MSRHDFDKLWIAQSINRAAMARASDAIAKLGSALPCSVVAVTGSMVTVAFEVNAPPFTLPQITIPKAESSWLRSPTQVGDYGLTIPADVHLSAVSGEGGGTVGAAQPGNLSGLVWVPVGSKGFSSVNSNAVFLQGPEGVVMQTQDGGASINIGTTGITLTFGGKVVTLDGSGLTIDGILFDTHKHTGVSIGGSNTGGPTS